MINSNETWAYLRISTEGQEDGNGLDVQRQHISAYVAATGCTVDRWIQDVQSGAKEDRDGLNELRAAVADGIVGTVLVYRLDRLARDAYLAEGLHREITTNAKIVSVTESLGDGIVGNLMRQIVQAFAEYERAVIASRLRGGRRSAGRTKGTFNGGPGCLGYRPVGSKNDAGKGELVIVESEAEAIRLAIDLRDAGQTYQQIADQLNLNGFSTVKGGNFTPTQIHRIIKRKAFYAGETVMARSYESDIAAHQPIIV